MIHSSYIFIQIITKTSCEVLPDTNKSQVRLKKLHRVLLSYKIRVLLTPTFAKVKGWFLNLKNQGSTEKKIEDSHLIEHQFHLKKTGGGTFVVNLNTL